MRIKQKMKRSESGQSMVELAVGLVMLLIILAGLLDVGRAVFAYLALQDAAQEGVSYGSINPTFCTQIEQRVNDNLATDETVNVTIEILDYPGGVETPYDCSDAYVHANVCSSMDIRVTVTQPDFRITMPLLGAALGTQSITLSATATDAVLRPPCGAWLFFNEGL